jgi:hypothetical protein
VSRGRPPCSSCRAQCLAGAPAAARCRSRVPATVLTSSRTVTAAMRRAAVGLDLLADAFGPLGDVVDADLEGVAGVLHVTHADEGLLLVVEPVAHLHVVHREAEEDADEDDRAGEHEQVVLVVVLQVHEVGDDQRRLHEGHQHGDGEAGRAEVHKGHGVGQPGQHEQDADDLVVEADRREVLVNLVGVRDDLAVEINFAHGISSVKARFALTSPGTAAGTGRSRPGRRGASRGRCSRRRRSCWR